MGERVGRSTVSRVAKRLDEAVEGLRRAPIEGPHPYLYLDATFLDARWARKVENVSRPPRSRYRDRYQPPSLPSSL